MTRDIEFLERELRRVGWYDPWYVKLALYLRNFFTGDWGESHFIIQGEKVLDIISIVFLKTLELMIFSIIIVPIIGIKLGISSAKNKNKPRDFLIRGTAILGAGFPVFYIALLVQKFVSVELVNFTYGGLIIPVVFANDPSLSNPYPPGGPKTGFRIIDRLLYNDPIYLFDTITHLIIPVICMTFVSLSGITRQTRSSMLDVMDQDYVRTARAKGVEERDVINRHALRNSLIPSSQLIIGGISASLLGSMLVEVTFNYYGMGYYFYAAIIQLDYLLINGFLVFSTLIIISGTLTADIVYTIIDPRIIY
jgi:peptide/nickel transport system permease protein